MTKPRNHYSVPNMGFLPIKDGQWEIAKVIMKEHELPVSDLHNRIMVKHDGGFTIVIFNFLQLCCIGVAYCCAHDKFRCNKGFEQAFRRGLKSGQLRVQEIASLMKIERPQIRHEGDLA